MNQPETADRRSPAQRLRDMIHALDVDVLELFYADLGGVYAGAAQTCLTCKNADACTRWLDAGENRPEHPGFCPNAALLARFSARRAGISARRTQTGPPAAWRGKG